MRVAGEVLRWQASIWPLLIGQPVSRIAPGPSFPTQGWARASADAGEALPWGQGTQHHLGGLPATEGCAKGLVGKCSHRPQAAPGNLATASSQDPFSSIIHGSLARRCPWGVGALKETLGPGGRGSGSGAYFPPAPLCLLSELASLIPLL